MSVSFISGKGADDLEVSVASNVPSLKKDILLDACGCANFCPKQGKGKMSGPPMSPINPPFTSAVQFALSQQPPQQPVQQVIPVPAVAIYASVFQMIWNSNEFSVLLAQNVPVLDGGTMAQRQQPLANVMLSPQSAKDLSILLANAVKDYESKFGEIKTEFTESGLTDNVGK